MNEPAEFNERLTKLESEVRRAREDSAAARILAGGADRDVSEMRAELRAHTGSLEALRETQVEQGKMLVEQGRILTGHGKRIEGLDKKVGRLEHKVVRLEDKVVRLEDKVVQLDHKVDAGFAQVDENLVKVGRHLGRLHTGQEHITELLTEHFGKPQET